jgi:hypothetical protein
MCPRVSSPWPIGLPGTWFRGWIRQVRVLQLWVEALDWGPTISTSTSRAEPYRSPAWLPGPVLPSSVQLLLYPARVGSDWHVSWQGCDPVANVV